MELLAIMCVEEMPLILPLYGGRVPAGFPPPAEDYLESQLDLNDGASGSLIEATNDTADLVGLSVSLARSVWRPGFRYAKAGVILTELVPETSLQPALWSDVDRERRAELWKVVDRLNLNLGRGTVGMLGMGKPDTSWKLRAAFRSPRWTTRWTELPQAKAS